MQQKISQTFFLLSTCLSYSTRIYLPLIRFYKKGHQIFGTQLRLRLRAHFVRKTEIVDRTTNRQTNTQTKAIIKLNDFESNLF